MAWRWKGRELPHPVGVAAAAGILLFGAHLNATVRSTAVAPPPQQSLGPVIATVPAEPPALPSMAAPPRAAPVPAAPRGGPAAPATAPLPAPRLPLGFIGPHLPVRGPQWKGEPLPAFSPEVLRAMMDPRAAHRAQRLRRLGIVLPGDPTSAGGLGPPVATQPPAVHAPSPTSHGPQIAHSLPTATVGAPGGKPSGSGAGPRSPEHSPPPAVSGTKLAAAPPVGPGVSPVGSAPLGESKHAGSKSEPAASQGEASGEPTGAAAGAAPIHLQARLDRPRPEYRAGEWVALRVLASQPAHLRVYRVDASGHVTRLFSTYNRDDSGQPAQAFSMMLKAGHPRPGQERLIAIGSVRPLTRDELLDCLRSYLAEGPTENATPAPPAAGAPKATGTATAREPMPLAAALQAVIDAVGRTGDLPAGMAGLDRSAWSVAVGRFVSMPKSYQQSAVGDRRPDGLPAP